MKIWFRENPDPVSSPHLHPYRYLKPETKRPKHLSPPRREPLTSNRKDRAPGAPSSQPPRNRGKKEEKKNPREARRRNEARTKVCFTRRAALENPRARSRPFWRNTQSAAGAAPPSYIRENVYKRQVARPQRSCGITRAGEIFHLIRLLLLPPGARRVGRRGALCSLNRNQWSCLYRTDL